MGREWRGRGRREGEGKGKGRVYRGTPPFIDPRYAPGNTYI